VPKKQAGQGDGPEGDGLRRGEGTKTGGEAARELDRRWSGRRGSGREADGARVGACLAKDMFGGRSAGSLVLLPQALQERGEGAS
jgi:hypothetical protein